MSRKIAKYGFASDSDTDRFVESIQDKISEGWQPFGGISVAMCKVNSEWIPYYAQAMVKYEKPEGPVHLPGVEEASIRLALNKDESDDQCNT